MNKHKSLKSTQSLLERASDLYGFNDVMRAKPQASDEKDRDSQKAEETTAKPDTAINGASKDIDTQHKPATANKPATGKSDQVQILIPERAEAVPAKPLPAQPLPAQPLPTQPVPFKPAISKAASVPSIKVGRGQDTHDNDAFDNDPSGDISEGPTVEGPTVEGPTSEGPAAENLISTDRLSADKLYRNKEVRKIDRQWLSDNNLLIPDGPVTALSEEFRIVKRQLLLAARGGKGVEAVEHGERILICSANPNEGKTYTSINLALSMASEKDNRVLLIDADFAKPSVLSTLNIEGGPGLMDALADPSLDVNQMVLSTDVEGLSILPAGSQSNQDTEYLAAARTAKLIEKLSKDDPTRIIIFDSPPALAASPASVLALHVGQTLMVVHADKTTDSALRDALNLLSGCDHVQLLLNRANFSPSGRKFGSYYGYGA